ncbi:hypothetical protein QT972_03220 [Microcoleus sp. herbarium7]
MIRGEKWALPIGRYDRKAKPGVVHRDLQVESEHRQCQERSRRSPFALT